jgi:arsenite/tail-anchored protein-transporting ATPase
VASADGHGPLAIGNTAVLLKQRIVFFGGKGGVGKTTCASAMALAASRAGRRVLLVSTDPAHSTSDLFERPIGPELVEILPNLTGLEIDGGFESKRYVSKVKEQVQAIFGPHILKEASRQIDLAASMPGAEEVALFDRMAELIRGDDDRFDLIVFDTAPTGHTLRLIQMPELMEAWIRALSRSRQAMLGADQDDSKDPIMSSLSDRLDRLREFRALLLSPRTTAFVLVLVPERLPIEETARALAQLHESSVTIGGLVVNRILPVTSPDPFLQSRHQQEQVYLDEIGRRFGSYSLVHLPQLPTDVHGIDTLGEIGALLTGGTPASQNTEGQLSR